MTNLGNKTLWYNPKICVEINKCLWEHMHTVHTVEVKQMFWMSTKHGLPQDAKIWSPER